MPPAEVRCCPSLAHFARMSGLNERITIRSSSLAWLRYSSDATLDVAFRRGAVYRYFLVPPNVVRNLLDASSIGAAFNATVRDRFRFVLLDRADSA